MAKSHSFWVIIDGAVPTAFRGKNREDLLPTLTQLKRTQPKVVLMWFERGRVWESPIAARAALEARRSNPRPRDRKPAWRPGGDHRDPRAKYQISRDEKRARFKKRRDFERRSDQGGPDMGGRPTGGDRRSDGDRRPKFADRPAGGARPKFGDRPFGGGRPKFDRPPTGSRPKFNDRPGNDERRRGDDRPRQYSDGGERRPPGSAKPPGGARGWRSPKPPRTDSTRSTSSRPTGGWKPRPGRHGDKPRKPRDDEK